VATKHRAALGFIFVTVPLDMLGFGIIAPRRNSPRLTAICAQDSDDSGRVVGKQEVIRLLPFPRHSGAMPRCQNRYTPT
jgi:hypothetical protein